MNGRITLSRAPVSATEPLPHFEAMVATAARIAARAVITDIESEGCRVGAPADRCWDIRPMLDEREHGPEGIDMFGEALAYAAARGLIVFDRGEPWLARIVVVAP